MFSTANKFRDLLSTKGVTIAILVLVIASRIIQLLFFYNIRVDGMYQVMAMQHFVHGHGISVADVLPGDLSVVTYHPLINWPPGYSLLLAPFYLAFGHNYIAAGITMDILFSIVLIFTCRNILKTLGLSLYLINCYTLLTGFFIYYFYLVASSDAIAISFFVIAVNYFLLLLKKGSSPKLLAGILIPLFFCGLIKYLFIPLVFIPPVYLFLKGLADKNKSFTKAGLIIFSVLGIGLLAVLLYQKMTSGSATYISEPSRGFFPENLKDAYPFIPASFIQPDTTGMLLRAETSGLQTISRIFQFIHLLILALLILFAFRQLFRYGLKRITLAGDFFWLLFLFATGSMVLLGVLSLFVPKEENVPGSFWTYIEEPRYYGLINVLLHLAVFVLYIYMQGSPLKKRLIPLFLFLLLLMGPEMFRGIIFDAKRVLSYNKETYSWQTEYRLQRFADDIIKKETNQGAKEITVVTGSSYYLNYRVGLYSHAAVMSQSGKINDPAGLQSSKPTLLLAILEEKQLPGYELFLSGTEKKLAGFLNGFYFYTLHVNPH
ncbi:MAG: hypothetical protein ABIR30_00785 [Chitinophagaceae bacterium]